MSSFAFDMAGNKVFASDALPSRYYKDEDGKLLRLCRGPVNKPYFSHISKARKSIYGNGKTDWHQGAQDVFPEELTEIIFRNRREVFRADVFVNGTEIEFQHSPMTSAEFRSRNAFYLSQDGIERVVWVFDMSGADIAPIGENLYRWKRPSSTFRGFVPPQGDAFPHDSLFGDIDDIDARRRVLGCDKVELFFEFPDKDFNGEPVLHRILQCCPSTTLSPIELLRSQEKQLSSWQDFDEGRSDAGYWNDWSAFVADTPYPFIRDLAEHYAV